MDRWLLGLQTFVSAEATDWGSVMAVATIIMALPMIVLSYPAHSPVGKYRSAKPRDAVIVAKRAQRPSEGRQDLSGHGCAPTIFITAGLRHHWEKALRTRMEARSNTAFHVTFAVNGVEREADIDPCVTLLDLLREHFHLTGTKKGCDHGQCGACTVLVNEKRINSCLVLAVSRNGAAITTIEGIGAPGALHPLQEAFVRHDALQCGYCTPGQICSAMGLILEGKAKTRDEIREAMSGNLCRCGAYIGIVDAIEEVLAAPGRATVP